MFENNHRRRDCATIVGEPILYKRFGLPDKIISDQGPQFASKAFVELLKLLGVKLSLSTTYHPQSDGTTKRVNRRLRHTWQFIALPTPRNG